MNLTIAIEILDAVPNFLWNGKPVGVNSPSGRPTREYVCHAVDHAAQYLYEKNNGGMLGYSAGMYYEASKKIQAEINNRLGGRGDTYVCVLRKLGVVPYGDAHEHYETVQQFRLKFVGVLRDFYAEQKAAEQ